MTAGIDYKREFERWLSKADASLQPELQQYDEAQIEDSFYRSLSFGTGGLRGIIGAGTNRMNIHTVAKASQGLVAYLRKEYGNEASVAIGYDSRINSDLFAKVAAGVFAANGVKVFIWNRLLPVPTVSYAVRYLGASAGVMITASHNPSQYNGYKVYGHDGCQITTGAAAEILEAIEAVDIFDGVHGESFDSGLASRKITYIDEAVFDSFLGEVKNQSVLYGDAIDKNVSIVYSPLNGTGLEPVTRILKEEGYTNITLVEEQKMPDGNFPTCPYPNPEIKEALALGIEYCRKTGADLMLATDPDCDRVGIAVRDRAGDYQLLSGNEVGLLLLDYICAQRVKHGTMPEGPLLLKTIVTIDMADRIAENYGLETINVLTGFKFIGEQIGILESRGEEHRYVFGFEESYGYLTGGYVRDKDGVDGAYMICEMLCFYRSQGISLLDKLNELYEKYGYSLNTLHSYKFDGPTGMAHMKKIMDHIRKHISVGSSFGEGKVLQVEDYSAGLNGLPKSDVLKIKLEHDSSFVVRPSGTEPKLKIYLSISADNRERAEAMERRLAEACQQLVASL